MLLPDKGEEKETEKDGKADGGRQKRGPMPDNIEDARAEENRCDRERMGYFGCSLCFLCFVWLFNFFVVEYSSPPSESSINLTMVYPLLQVTPFPFPLPQHPDAPFLVHPHACLPFLNNRRFMKGEKKKSTKNPTAVAVIALGKFIQGPAVRDCHVINSNDPSHPPCEPSQAPMH